MRPQTMRDQQIDCEICCCCTTLLIVVLIGLGIPGICLIYYFSPIDAMHSRGSTLICAYGMKPTDKISCPVEYSLGVPTTQNPLILMFNGSDPALKVCSSRCYSNLRKTSQCAIGLDSAPTHSTLRVSGGYGIWVLNDYATQATFNYNGCSLPPDGLFLTGWVFISITSVTLFGFLMCLITPHICSSNQINPSSNQNVPSIETV
jgi:hypothetical protein